MTHIARLSGRMTNWAIGLTPYRAPLSEDDALAREAVASVEEQEWPEVAKHRRNGAYDGDDEHQIALAAIRLMRLQFNREAGVPNKQPASNQ